MNAAVIFDMDGVILDSEVPYVECWKAVGEEYGLRDVVEMSHRIIGVNEEKSRSLFNEFYAGAHDYDKCRTRVFELFHARYDGRIPLKSGVPEILAFLKERRVPIALASSTDIRTIERELGDVGLGRVFDHVIGGDMIRRSKPEPDIFLAAAQKLGTAPCNCYVIEDSHNGIRAAAAAGMHPIMIPDLLEVTEEMQTLAETICPSLHAAIEYLTDRL